MESFARKTILFSFVAILLLGSTVQAQYRCMEGDCINGKGKKVLEDGISGMEGNFFEGTLVTGKVMFPNGDVFEGVFENNMLTQGAKRFKNGRTYEGMFKSNVLVDGRIIEPDGSIHNIKMRDLRDPRSHSRANQNFPR